MDSLAKSDMKIFIRKKISNSIIFYCFIIQNVDSDIVNESKMTISSIKELASYYLDFISKDEENVYIKTSFPQESFGLWSEDKLPLYELYEGLTQYETEQFASEVNNFSIS